MPRRPTNSSTRADARRVAWASLHHPDLTDKGRESALLIIAALDQEEAGLRSAARMVEGILDLLDRRETPA